MGEQAAYFLEQVCDEESLRDDYALGFMSNEDAYEHGFIDELGCEQGGIQDAYDRNNLNDINGLDSDIEILELKLMNSALMSERSNLPPSATGFNYDNLNDKAIENLFNEHPTCNICEKEMQKRNGKFGAFYFCSCEGQKTVSESYWLSIKIG